MAKMANEPTGDALVDYLAGDLVEHGFDLKRLIEQIVTSRAYQSRAVVNDEEGTADDDFYRGPGVKRMTAEQFLDAVWMITKAGPIKVEAPIRPASIAEGGPLD